MKKMKLALSLMLVLCLTFCLVGCSSNHDKRSLKDNLIDGFNSWMQSFSKHALTREKDLQGKKEKGSDAYTGTYGAAYDGFNGKEFIFGGTALERENERISKVFRILRARSAEKSESILSYSTGQHNAICAPGYMPGKSSMQPAQDLPTGRWYSR